MTHTPLPPQMPPPEPLDEAERALARVLQNLPAASPPPELDARILGAARRAVYAAPRKREGRRWLVGFGTAATALFAVGIMLKTHGPSQTAIYTPPAESSAVKASPDGANSNASSPADGNAVSATSAQSAKEAARMDSTAVTGAAASEATAPPPPPPPPAVMQLPASTMPSAAPEAEPEPARGQDDYSREEQASPQAFPAAKPGLVAPRSPAAPPPAPPAPPVIVDEVTPMATAPPAPAMSAPAQSVVDERAERKTESDRSNGSVGAISKQSAANQPTGRADAAQGQVVVGGNASDKDNLTSKAKSLDMVTLPGSRVERDKAPSNPATDDASVNPSTWIERIRARVRKGDHAGATASLKALLTANPHLAIPDDLQPLLQ